MTTKLFIFTLLILVTVFGCESNNEQAETKMAANGAHKVVVNEVVHATKYTYLKVNENNQDYWIAVTKREIAEGSTVYFSEGLEMKNFESKDLQRTFDKVLFVQELSAQPLQTESGMPKKAHGKITSAEKGDISVEPAADGISIGELYDNRNDYVAKMVKIRGQVTKFNQGIMGRNWVHLQDGTKSGSDYDLTVTTQDVVKVGDVVTFEGKIVLDKDFGAGYAYAVIMEEANKR